MLLVVALVLSFVVVPESVSAANAYTVRLGDAAGNSVVTAKPGDTVALTLSLENNPGIIGVGVQMSYPTGLSLTEKPALNLMGLAAANTTFSDGSSQYITSNPYLVWLNMATGTMDNKLVTYNGKIADLSFKVAEDIEPGDYTITLAAPADKNSTAGVDGQGKIIPGSIIDVTNIALISCIIRVESDECAHSWGEWTDKPGEVADCENPGKQIRECSICHETEEKDVPAKEHSFTTYTETSAATCIDNAKETATCDNGCGTTDEREVAGSATEVHSFQGQPWIPNNDATCTANGTRYRICAIPGCGAKEKAVEDPDTMLEHAYGPWEVKDETFYKHTCTDCGFEEKTYIEYVITFQCDDGTIISQATYHYGDTIEIPAEPAAPSHWMGNYEFTGWDKEIPGTCLGDAVYTASFIRHNPDGDINGDMEVTSDDVIELLLHVTMPDVFQINIDVDFNSDGEVTSDDVIQMLLHVTMPDYFPLRTGG